MEDAVFLVSEAANASRRSDLIISVVFSARPLVLESNAENLVSDIGFVLPKDPSRVVDARFGPIPPSDFPD